MTTRARRTLASAGLAHFLHDGFADIIYVFLPLWQRDLALSLTQVGIIRTAYTGAMSLLQTPAGFLAERWGERRLLVAGTAVTAGGFLLLGWADTLAYEISAIGLPGGFLALLVFLVLAGAASGVQHPLSSSLVSQAYETGARRAALGTYNFSGDVGKVTAAAGIAALTAAIGWRDAATTAGVLGLVGAAVIAVALKGAVEVTTVLRERAEGHGRSGWGIRDLRGFQALSAVGMIDNATRTGVLTFLPFALIAHGVSPAAAGGALAIVFAGGAVGKFVCGFLAERLGLIRTVVLTEAATALGILTIVLAPASVVFAILFPLGIALNGTSSVLYATVADLVEPDRRSRAYGLYYTLTIGASAIAPTVYGIVGDFVGVPGTLTIVGLVVLTTIPLCLVLRSAVAAPARV
ncbi:MAG: MFS transporter [Candidatus Rokubacteria bacterium]|nr:MFS transporter [Candidatus Rokubacteria bacterium]